MVIIIQDKYQMFNKKNAQEIFSPYPIDNISTILNPPVIKRNNVIDTVIENNPEMAQKQEFTCIICKTGNYNGELESDIEQGYCIQEGNIKTIRFQFKTHKDARGRLNGLDRSKFFPHSQVLVCSGCCYPILYCMRNGVCFGVDVTEQLVNVRHELIQEHIAREGMYGTQMKGSVEEPLDSGYYLETCFEIKEKQPPAQNSRFQEVRKEAPRSRPEGTNFFAHRKGGNPVEFRSDSFDHFGELSAYHGEMKNTLSNQFQEHPNMERSLSSKRKYEAFSQPYQIQTPFSIEYDDDAIMGDVLTNHVDQMDTISNQMGDLSLTQSLEPRTQLQIEEKSNRDSQKEKNMQMVKDLYRTFLKPSQYRKIVCRSDEYRGELDHHMSVQRRPFGENLEFLFNSHEEAKDTLNALNVSGEQIRFFPEKFDGADVCHTCDYTLEVCLCSDQCTHVEPDHRTEEVFGMRQKVLDSYVNMNKVIQQSETPLDHKFSLITTHSVQPFSLTSPETTRRTKSVLSLNRAPPPKPPRNFFSIQ